MSVTRRITAIALAAAAASLLVTAPAHAASVSAQCGVGFQGIDGWNLAAGADYTVVGANHKWTNAYYMITGIGLAGDENNVNIRLRDGAGRSDSDPTHWSYNSPDDRKIGQLYTAPINVTVPAVKDEYVKFHAIIDIPLAPDPGCKAYTDLV